MATIVNDRDILLQATDPRYTPVASVLNTAAILIYVRLATGEVPPDLPSADCTYTFATGVLTGLTNDWTQTVPPADVLKPFLFIASATAINTDATDTVVNADWSTPQILVRDGATGATGTPAQRAPTQLASSSYTAWDDDVAEAVLIAAGFGAPINRDSVILFSEPPDEPFSEIRFYNEGDGWLPLAAYFPGNVLVDGTVSCRALVADTMTGQEYRTATTFPRIEINHADDNMFKAYDDAGNLLAQIGAGATGGTVAASSNESGLGAVWGSSSASGPGVVGINESGSGNGTTGTIDNTSNNAAAVAGYTDGGGVAVYAETTGSSMTAIAMVGASFHGSEGWVGSANGYDFYAAGSGTNYGPFTGAHDCLLPLDTAFEVGDIVVDVLCIARRGYSNTIFKVSPSTAPRQRNVLGVLVIDHGPLAARQPAVFIEETRREPNEYGQSVRTVVMSALYDELADVFDVGAANALGEGQVNVTGENGDIEAGDWIVTSSTRGKGMRQGDSLYQDFTVAKAREACTFSHPGEVKQIACFYRCG